MDPTTPPRRHYVFDAYGTLFDVHSAAARHRQEIGPAWERLSQTWRTKQLEYTWINAGIARTATFRSVTEAALDFSIAAIGGVPAGVRGKLLEAYEHLAAFPEVPGVLRRLKEAGATTAILSNGDPDMLETALRAAGLVDLIDVTLSVASIGLFKPVPAVYALATDHFAVAPSAISFQSSNRWDVAGGKAFGYHCVWINRSGAPDEYPSLPYDTTMATLDALLTAAH